MNSGSSTTNNYNGTWLKFEWWTIEKNIQGNYTVISYVLKTERNKSGYTIGGNTKLIINNSQVHFDGSRRNFYNGTVVASGNFRINHNEQGKESIGVYMEMAVYANAVNVRGEFRHDLDDIARKAYFMYEPPNIVDKANGSIDGPIAIVNPGGLRTRLEIEMFGGHKYFATDNIEAGKWYYLLNDSEGRKTEFRKLMRNTSITDLNWVLTTFANDGSIIGYDIRTGEKAIIEEVKPDFSNFSLIEKNQKVIDLIGSKTNEFVQGQSEVYVNIKQYDHMKAKKYAEPNMYIVSCGEMLYYKTNSEDVKTETNIVYKKENLTLKGDVDFVVAAEDTRGFKKTATQKVKVHEYFKPIINAEIRRRNNFDEAIEIKVDGKYPHIIDGQTFTLKLYYRKAGDSSFTYSRSLSLNVNDGKYQLSRGVERIYLNQANDYEIKLVLDSYFESTEEIYRINKGKAILFISSNEEKVYENGNLIVGQNIVSTKIKPILHYINGNGNDFLRTLSTEKVITVGDKITAIKDNTGVIIGKGVKKVRVDAFVGSEERADELWVTVWKNRWREAIFGNLNTTAEELYRFRNTVIGWNQFQVCGIIAEVKEHDTITFEVGRWAGTDKFKTTGGYFTVQAVE